MNIIPKNPLEDLTDGNMLQIIVFAIFVGFALTALGEKTKGILHLVEQGNQIIMYLVGIAMKFAPYGTFGLLASAIGNQGLDAIQAHGDVHALCSRGFSSSWLSHIRWDDPFIR